MKGSKPNESVSAKADAHDHGNPSLATTTEADNLYIKSWTSKSEGQRWPVRHIGGGSLTKEQRKGTE